MDDKTLDSLRRDIERLLINGDIIGYSLEDDYVIIVATERNDINKIKRLLDNYDIKYRILFISKVPEKFNA